MKIAVLMSTYNGEKYLRKQLESIVHQSLHDELYLYIRDDGSKDNTLNIVDSYKNRINITSFKGQNIGPAKSFWTLFMNDNIQADYYAFCDQDDVWDSNKLEVAIDSISREEQKDERLPVLWCSNYRLINSNDNVINSYVNTDTPKFTIPAQLVCGTTQGAAMVFNDTLRKYVYDKDVKKFPMHDFVLMTYCIASGKVLYDSIPRFSYRVHENNVVAREGKGVLAHIKETLNLWVSKDHKNEVSDFAQVIMKDNQLDIQTKTFINDLINSKKSITSRISVINSPLCDVGNKQGERSFKARTLLGII